MKRTNIYLIVLLLGVLASCNKDEPKPSQNITAKNYRIKKYYFGVSSDKSLMGYFEYSYLNNKISTSKYYDSLGNILLTDSLFYDANGNLSKKTTNTIVAVNYVYDFLYNSDNKLSDYYLSTTGNVKKDTVKFYYDNNNRLVRTIESTLQSKYGYLPSDLNFSSIEYSKDTFKTVFQKDLNLYDNKNNIFGENYKNVYPTYPILTNNLISVNYYDSINTLFYQIQNTYTYQNNYPVSCKIESFTVTQQKNKVNEYFMLFEYESY